VEANGKLEREISAHGNENAWDLHTSREHNPWNYVHALAYLLYKTRFATQRLTDHPR
jgi:hypothetical protein